MDLYEYIYRRKSSRKYRTETLRDSELSALREAIDSFDTLYPDIELDYRIVNETKGLLKADAPHYLIVSGQGKAREEESAGFLFEQCVLWLNAHDIGSVWLGKAKDADEGSDKDIITIAFGRTTTSPHRDRDEFKRKPLEDISNDPMDICVQALHLAPSGINLQPWYLERNKDSAETLLYRQKPSLATSLMYKKTDVDMGIALSHYAIASSHVGRPFSFERTDNGPTKRGYDLFGVISEHE